jgi:hypothetical protein
MGVPDLTSSLIDMQMMPESPSSHLLAIDPGPRESAWLIYDAIEKRPVTWAKQPNEQVLDAVNDLRLGMPLLAIEMVASMGMAVGASVFQTCLWIGRFIERRQPSPYRLIYRDDVKLHLCGHRGRPKDANIRQALLDRYGSTREVAIGKKAAPGPLYGMAGDCWSALAVAVTAAETEETPSD